jgi:hypothetical protein
MPQTRDSADRRLTTSAPRWVKLFAIILIALVLLIGFMLITGVGGEHGPDRHMPSHNSGGYTLPLVKDAQAPIATGNPCDVIDAETGYAEAGTITAVALHPLRNQIPASGLGGHLLSGGGHW